MSNGLRAAAVAAQTMGRSPEALAAELKEREALTAGAVGADAAGPAPVRSGVRIPVEVVARVAADVAAGFLSGLALEVEALRVRCALSVPESERALCAALGEALAIRAAGRAGRPAVLARVVCSACGDSVADLPAGLSRGPQVLALCWRCRGLGWRVVLGQVPGVDAMALELVEPQEDTCLRRGQEGVLDFRGEAARGPVDGGQSCPEA
jgi:hypothetical protein